MHVFSRHRLRHFWLLCISLLIAPWAYQHIPPPIPFETKLACRLSSIHDGDTIRARCNGDAIKIRLFCIDAPELTQKPWGQESRDALREWLPRGAQFELHQHGRDRYGRYIGELVKDGVNLNQRLVSEGYAAVYRKYCPSRQKKYYAAEQRATQEHLGIWEKPGLHQTPWAWRHQKRAQHQQ